MLRARALREHGDARARTSPMLPGWLHNLHPALREHAAQLEASGGLKLHSHARALNSSQAFAANLFLPFALGRGEALEALVGASLGRRVRLLGVELEHYGHGDILAELRGAHPGPKEPHTAADVALLLEDAAGAAGLLLVEVKLGELDFTPCGGADSRGNRDRAPCESASLFFEQPQRCYLRRPLRARRDRRYQAIFEAAHGSWRGAFPGAPAAGPCPFVAHWQQPMRNHALALGSVQAGRAAFWGLALVHHDHNPDVPGPWDAYRAACADARHIFRWPASSLLPAIQAAGLAPDHAAWLASRYFLPAGVP